MPLNNHILNVIEHSLELDVIKFDAAGDSSGALFRVYKIAADGTLSSSDAEDVRF